ncbi:MAG: catalase family protein [Candidatus Riflebacteria bacterium]|nr:catalase family protein [Candidatus Riflebacteria bacterium]
MNPELNREYPDPGEAKLIEEMVQLTVDRMKPQQGRIRRGVHAKATGCVRGVFRIRDDVKGDLRHGVFSQPNHSFQAIVRFSNSSETIEQDGKGDARGMAIKLLDVNGPQATPGTNNRCQDFLAVNHPTFPFATPAEYLKFFDIRKTPLVGDSLAVAWLGLFHYRHLKIGKEILGKIIADPLDLKYWSCSPYWLGQAGTTVGHAVKYSIVPRLEGMELSGNPKGMADNYLTQTLGQHLRMREAIFDFRVQLQTDPVTMPVEDVSVDWDEEASKPIPVATLTIGVQDIYSPEGNALFEECEGMAFSPWNALAEHRPIGGINRMRQAVYLASQAKRASKCLP